MLVNGFPKGFFKGSRGLRQGGPLSPYLFIMVVDFMGRMVAKAEIVGLVRGFHLRGGMSVSFIQFADDSIFMVKAEIEDLQNLRCLLLIMETATGLKVNWSKSTLSLVGNSHNMESLAVVLECEVKALPITYLGLPLGAKTFSSAIWNPVIERLNR